MQYRPLKLPIQSHLLTNAGFIAAFHDILILYFSIFMSFVDVRYLIENYF